MQTWVPFVIGCSIAFLIGVFFQSIWRILSQIVIGGFKSLTRKQIYPFTETHNAKLAATLFALLTLSIASWFFSYYATQHNLNPIWSEIAIAIFGISTAGLLGGVVFEMFLRKEILAEVSETLAEIITTDKNVAKEIFNNEKRNKIIETMLQLNTGNEVYGSALYSDFVAIFTDESVGSSREFRFSFRDYVTFSSIDPKYGDLVDKYYTVVDRLSYRTELRPSNFILGCASTEDQLYALFSDPACIYRWLLKATDFESLVASGKGFSVSLVVGGIECEPLNGQGALGSRGFEVHFKNPFLEPKAPRELSKKIGQIVDFHIEVHTLHPCEERVLSVHLAYPVQGVEIGFDYENTDIRNVTKLYFFTAGRHTPRIEAGVEPKWAPKQHRLLIKVSDDHWLFPDSGVAFVW